jgi:hypothetical protein
MMAAASAFTATGDFGHFTDALGIARGLSAHISPVEGTIFALLLFDASIVGASAVTLATSYAFGDIFGIRHSLHRGIREAKLFYGSYTAMVAVAAAIVLIPHAPLGLITTAVQALAGTLLPSATVFLVLLCNDRAVLGPWMNKPWLNVIATIIVSALLLLSLVLVVSTLVPSINVNVLVVVMGAAMAAVVVVTSGWVLWSSRHGEPVPAMPRAEKESWRMPALALLERPQWSLPRRIAMTAMASYIVVAVLFLAVKAVQIAINHH